MSVWQVEDDHDREAPSVPIFPSYYGKDPESGDAGKFFEPMIVS